MACGNEEGAKRRVQGWRDGGPLFTPRPAKLPEPTLFMIPLWPNGALIALEGEGDWEG